MDCFTFKLPTQAFQLISKCFFKLIFLFLLFTCLLCPMSKKVRVRFAPSPTGGLHLGGVRTVLYNYLFAKKHGGDFVLRIEDTDQTRFVEGAEAYINECLHWCGLEPDESPFKGGPHAPYRQSERKPMYRQFAEQLVKDGHAYYAFDTPEELEQMRQQFKTEANPSPMYDSKIRQQMRNSLSLSAAKVEALLAQQTPHVVRIKMPENETVTIDDLVRGQVSFNTALVDDKVLLKADGMPTYHLAVVVDDHAMEISHAFRGEEWLPSAPVHILLWKHLFGLDKMPQWAHLPLILKPDGNGKLSKRDGERLGFPVFGMSWTDPKTNETTNGFRERGFLPAAFVNVLALLGWNDGSEQELFSMQELIEKFDIARVHKGGAKFDFEKAKWFNHEWIKKTDAAALLPGVKAIYASKGIAVQADAYMINVINMIKERCTLLPDFYEQGVFFFQSPASLDEAAVKPKWTPEKQAFFQQWIQHSTSIAQWDAPNIEQEFKNQAAASNIKVGELQLPLRVMLVGGKFGPAVFDIVAMIGQAATNERIANALKVLS
jgi:glutamyl-tRNA synthetase